VSDYPDGGESDMLALLFHLNRHLFLFFGELLASCKFDLAAHRKAHSVRSVVSSTALVVFMYRDRYSDGAYLLSDWAEILCQALIQHSEPEIQSLSYRPQAGLILACLHVIPHNQAKTRLNSVAISFIVSSLLVAVLKC